jgi:hypothetical protein
MNHSFSKPLSLCRLLLVVGALSPVVASAQSPNQSESPKKTDLVVSEKDLSDYRKGATSALAQARANNLVAAEATLATLNKSAPNSATWHMEAAKRLVQLAEQLARSNQSRNVTALANRALANLALAEELAREPGQRAAAKMLAGFVQERYLANPEAARASYESAVPLAPEGESRAKEAAERLQGNDDHLRSKGGNK